MLAPLSAGGASAAAARAAPGLLPIPARRLLAAACPARRVQGGQGAHRQRAAGRRRVPGCRLPLPARLLRGASAPRAREMCAGCDASHGAGAAAGVPAGPAGDLPARAAVPSVSPRAACTPCRCACLLTPRTRPAPPRPAPPPVAALCRAVKAHAVALAAPRRGVLPLRCAVAKLCPSTDHLSPIHADLFQLCAALHPLPLRCAVPPARAVPLPACRAAALQQGAGLPLLRCCRRATAAPTCCSTPTPTHPPGQATRPAAACWRGATAARVPRWTLTCTRWTPPRQLSRPPTYCCTAITARCWRSAGALPSCVQPPPLCCAAAGGSLGRRWLARSAGRRLGVQAMPPPPLPSTMPSTP